jgi:N-acetylmuramoyl-L-alanine amidase
MVHKIRHCRVFKTTGMIFTAAMLLLAGCTTSPTPPDETISPAPASGGTADLNWSVPGIVQKSVVHVPKTNVPQAVRTNHPAAIVPKPASSPFLTWTSLNRWAAEHKVAAPRLVSSTPLTTYAVSSASGVLVVGIGTLSATWNGIEINLGFAPEFIDGEVFLHGLDLEKNLEPLLCGPPLAFGTNRVIVIDPGHGGDNHGTYVHSVQAGPFEKEFTLDWALRLKPLLEQEGWKVFLTRTSDVYVTNSDRVVFAEAHHADLFISLHFNSTDLDKKTGKRDEKTGGLETYCLTPTGMFSTLTRDYADPQFENLPNNNFDAQNLQLAVRVQGALRITGLEDRGVRRSRFDTVLRGQNRPAILVEGGYLSNPAEAKLIASPEYRQKLAQAVASALK